MCLLLKCFVKHNLFDINQIFLLIFLSSLFLHVVWQPHFEAQLHTLPGRPFHHIIVKILFVHFRHFENYGSFFTKASVTCDGSVHFTMDVERDLGPFPHFSTKKGNPKKSFFVIGIRIPKKPLLFLNFVIKMATSFSEVSAKLKREMDQGAH